VERQVAVSSRFSQLWTVVTARLKYPQSPSHEIQPSSGVRDGGVAGMVSPSRSLIVRSFAKLLQSQMVRTRLAELQRAVFDGQVSGLTASLRIAFESTTNVSHK